jgi:hypothetical protein
MVRKVMAGQDLLKASGTVTGKLVRWLAAHGYIDEDMAEDAAEQAREASRDLPMANRLANLLHELADAAPEVDVDALAEEDWSRITSRSPMLSQAGSGSRATSDRSSCHARRVISRGRAGRRSDRGENRWDLAAARGRLRLPLISQ